MIKNSYKTNQNIYESEFIESSNIDSNIILKILIKAGISIAKPALEVLEMAIDPLTPTNVRISLIASLAYLCLLYTSPSPRDIRRSRMPSSA